MDSNEVVFVKCLIQYQAYSEHFSMVIMIAINYINFITSVPCTNKMKYKSGCQAIVRKKYQKIYNTQKVTGKINFKVFTLWLLEDQFPQVYGVFETMYGAKL
jgi:hypothetical protein